MILYRVVEVILMSSEINQLTIGIPSRLRIRPPTPYHGRDSTFWRQISIFFTGHRKHTLQPLQIRLTSKTNEHRERALISI